MADFTLDESYLTRKREQFKNDIAYARYEVDGTWHEASIQNAEVMTNGIVEAIFVIDPTVSGNMTVTGVELYDHGRRRIGGNEVSITRTDATEGMLYVCRLRVFQATENSKHTGAYDEL